MNEAHEVRLLLNHTRLDEPCSCGAVERAPAFALVSGGFVMCERCAELRAPALAEVAGNLERAIDDIGMESSEVCQIVYGLARLGCEYRDELWFLDAAEQVLIRGRLARLVPGWLTACQEGRLT